MYNKTQHHKAVYYELLFPELQPHSVTHAHRCARFSIRQAHAAHVETGGRLFLCLWILRDCVISPHAKPLFDSVYRSNMTEVRKVLFPPTANIYR